MHTKKYSQIETNELLELVQNVSQNINKYDAVLSVVFTKISNGSWKFLIGKCELPGDLDELEEIYSNIAFYRKASIDFELETFLTSLDSSGYNISEFLPALKNECGASRWNDELIPSNFTKSKQPEHKYSARISQSVEFMESPLIGYGLPYHSSSSEYLRNFMGLSVYHGQSHGENGEFSIFVPDNRGRIVSKNEVVSIDGSEKEICLVGERKSGIKFKIDRKSPLRMSEAELLSSEAWLLNKNNEILDFRSASKSKYNLSRSDDAQLKAEHLISLIENGENHLLEFKTYIDLKNKKATEIEKTVCAFSNARGGKLVIGVDDEGNIVGIGEKVREAYRGPLTETLDEYANAIKKRIRETLRFGQCFNLEVIKIGKEQVILITVERTEKTNYYLNSDLELAYVRKGATSRKMRSNEDREIEPSLFFS